MCYVQAAMAAIAIVTSYVKDSQQNKQTKQAERNLNEQNDMRSKEIDRKYGIELNERARAARRERAAMRVATAESGVNLGSNSFLAQLQSSELNQGQSSGTIIENKNVEQKARQSEYKSRLSQLSYITELGKGMNASAAGMSAFMGSGGMSYFGRDSGGGGR